LEEWEEKKKIEEEIVDVFESFLKEETKWKERT